MIDQFPYMAVALEAARAASDLGEVPVGAVITDKGGQILSVASNRVVTDRDPSAHAEILALRQAAVQIGSERLTDCDLWVTLEPCPMCAQAISFARIRRLYYGADDPKGGAITTAVNLFAQPTVHHRPEVYGGISEIEAGQLLKAFFQARRS